MVTEAWRVVWSLYWQRFRVSIDADRERGEVSLTTVILAFLLAGLAITVGGIIVSKVTAKANSIPTD